MKKLIRLFNDKYGKEYGTIDDDYTIEESYQIFRLIKKIINEDDTEIQNQLNKIHLDKPQNISEQISSLDSVVNDMGSTIAMLDYVNVMQTLPLVKLQAPHGQVMTDTLPIDETYTQEQFNELVKQIKLKPSKVDVGETFNVLTCGAFGNSIYVSGEKFECRELDFTFMALDIELTYENSKLKGNMIIKSYIPYPKLNLEFDSEGANLLVTIGDITKKVSVSDIAQI